MNSFELDLTSRLKFESLLIKNKFPSTNKESQLFSFLSLKLLMEIIFIEFSESMIPAF